MGPRRRAELQKTVGAGALPAGRVEAPSTGGVRRRSTESPRSSLDSWFAEVGFFIPPLDGKGQHDCVNAHLVLSGWGQAWPAGGGGIFYTQYMGMAYFTNLP